MGQFARELFEANDDNGYPYRLWKRDGGHFEMTDLDLARDAISQTGREVVMGALDTRGEHHDGVVRVRPELGEESMTQLGALGIGEAPLFPTSR